MKKVPTAIQLSIPEPCNQSWDNMQVVARGRHCSQCQKAVIDFTGMTDTQLLEYFRNNNSPACGRFTDLQLDRVIREVTAPRDAWIARIAAGILLVVGLIRPAAGQSKKSSHNTQQSALDKVSQQATEHPTTLEPQAHKPVTIKGVLVDEHGDAIIDANVEVSVACKVIGRALTDFDGLYSINNIPGDTGENYEVRFSYMGKEVIVSRVLNAGELLTINGKIRISPPGDRNIHVFMGRPWIPPIVDIRGNSESYFPGDAISTQYYTAGNITPLSMLASNLPSLQLYSISENNTEIETKVSISKWQRLKNRFRRLFFD